MKRKLTFSFLFFYSKVPCFFFSSVISPGVNYTGEAKVWEEEGGKALTSGDTVMYDFIRETNS